MQDGQSSEAGRQFMRASSGGVVAFAADVVARLMKGEVSMTLPLREDLIDRMMHAVVNSDMTDFEALKPDLRRARISPIVFADRYLPEIARRLGKAWEDDRMTFAEVTMGASRLQAILRQIGAGPFADDGAADDGGWATLLLIVPQGQQHTLGAFVLLGQLRRRGISVCLRVGPTDDDLRALISQRSFDGAMVSLALPEQLEATCAMLRMLKQQTAGRLPVALGGAALLLASIKVPEDCADIVTNDLSTAITALGLGVAQPNLPA
jgi:MerR family transcriptional regulator, light-induced transcriptional regulator